MTGTDFLLQAPAVAPAVLTSLARRAQARAIVPVGTGAPVAYRFPDVAGSDDVLAAARAAGCDGAFVPSRRRIDEVSIVAMDMDSTLITIECIDEIADMKGIRAEVAAITASAMRGEIDFAESLARRVALLTGLAAAELEHVYDERLRISPGAARMLKEFKAAGATTALVSGGFTFFTERLRAALPLDVAVANTLEVAGGRLTGRIEGPIVDGEAKAAAVRALKAGSGRGGITVAIGDGANDLPMFAVSDVAIAYRAKPRVRAQATYALDVCGLDAALNFFR